MTTKINSQLTYFYISVLLSMGLVSASAQSFQKITDPQNPIVSFVPPTNSFGSNYSGAAWVDYDSDGDLDLSVSPWFIFQNEGNGDFTRMDSLIGENQVIQLGNGLTWGDYDNDGDADCFLAGFPSTLYQNQGDGTFAVVDTGAIGAGQGFRGWNAAWADYDNDGYLDLVITHPAGFLGTSKASRFLRNLGTGGFAIIDTFEFTTVFAPYTVATWSDYDDDGDSDLFIGSGPAGTTALDFLYDNLLFPSGTANLQRMTVPIMSTDQQDGQTWNWIDYDNDGDLDGMITNYSGTSSRFYRNDGNGMYTRLNVFFGNGPHLANTWGDLDNDGDLDAIISSDSGPTIYFDNDGMGGLIPKVTELTESGFTSCPTFGDHDNDGDLDVFISGVSGKALFENLADTTDNHWVNIRCFGSHSNRLAIGTKVKIKATVNGRSIWQRREISAQNSFNGHNSLRVHFGLGDGTMIDSLLIEWPSGITNYYTGLAADSFYTYTETEYSTIGPPLDPPPFVTGLKVVPNPSDGIFIFQYDLFERSSVLIEVFDYQGNKISTVANIRTQASGNHQWEWAASNLVGQPLASGVYIVRLTTDYEVATSRIALIR